ncbi:MAG: aminoacyl-tRNA hydrolase [Spirochaetaceae bacterium]|jgi:PTH1 family peptidyl-tRNA hydrolase|nr:aminoacyl-tRNA hydrolase [Spirochaetaceae bacterium]
MKKIRLVVLLGNPGKMYAENRHNAGRLLAGSLSIPLQWRNKFKGLYAAAPLPPGGENAAAEAGASFAGSGTGHEGGTPEAAHFLMPETYMNLSGESVLAAAAYYKIPCGEILVVHDELELPPGQAAFKEGGGLGGHNGLRSIKTCLGSADFWRLRIGIGRPGGRKERNADISGWVLSDFSAEEAAVLRRVMDVCAGALLQALRYGPDSLLPEWNKMKICPPSGT